MVGELRERERENWEPLAGSDICSVKLSNDVRSYAISVEFVVMRCELEMIPRQEVSAYCACIIVRPEDNYER